MKKLIILDYSDSSVHFYDVDSEVVTPDISKLGYKDSNCEWMIGDNMSITFHKEQIK